MNRMFYEVSRLGHNLCKLYKMFYEVSRLGHSLCKLYNALYQNTVHVRNDLTYVAKKIYIYMFI